MLLVLMLKMCAAVPGLQAHVEMVAVSSFLAAVEQCVDPDCRRALKAMADLFALRCIEKDMLFRNDEYVAPAKVSTIQLLLWQTRGLRVQV